MSDYEDDDLSYEYFSEDEQEVDDEEAFLGNEANGHGIKDEEDEQENKAEEELYGDVEPQEPEDDGDKPVDDYEEDLIDIEVVEEKVDGFKKILNSKRKTSKVMTKFEYSYLISQRAMAIEQGSPLMFPRTKYIHAIDIAKEETHLGINPIIIQRILPSNSGDLIEEWRCSELIVPFAYIEEDEDFFEKF
jgi:DNA-directed RNA polymerase subunit K/omega